MTGWPAPMLSEVLLESPPGFACGENSANGVFQFRMNNITVEGPLDLSKKRRVPGNGRPLETFLVSAGDVLFNATNSPDLIGKAAYFLGIDEPVVFSNHFLRLRPRPERLEGRYLARWLNLQFERGVFKNMCRQGVNQATVNRDAFLALRLPLPSLSEQRRIAAILDKADGLREGPRRPRSARHAHTGDLLETFGDPVTNPKDWPVQLLSDVGTLDRGVSKHRPAECAGVARRTLRRGARCLEPGAWASCLGARCGPVPRAGCLPGA